MKLSLVEGGEVRLRKCPQDERASVVSGGFQSRSFDTDESFKNTFCPRVFYDGFARKRLAKWTEDMKVVLLLGRDFSSRGDR